MELNTLAVLKAQGNDWIPNSVGRFAGLIDDGNYKHELMNRLKAMFYLPEVVSSLSRLKIFANLPVVNFPVGSGTHSTQDGFFAHKLLSMLLGPSCPGGAILVVEDREHDRVMIFDGNHRYANAIIRGKFTVPARVLIL